MPTLRRAALALFRRPGQFAIDRTWHLINGHGKLVGRLATQVSQLLQGRSKVGSFPNVDGGDYVVVYNAKHLTFTGRKMQDKVYRHHTGYPGGLKEIPAWSMNEKHPDRILRRAVQGMLPKNLHRRARLRRLRVFADADVPRAVLDNCSVPSLPADVLPDRELTQAEIDAMFKEPAGWIDATHPSRVVRLE